MPLQEEQNIAALQDTSLNLQNIIAITSSDAINNTHEIHYMLNDKYHRESVPTSNIPPALLKNLSLPTSLWFSTKPQRIHVIVSTHSGTGKGREVYSSAVQPFLASLLPDADIDVSETQSAESVSIIVREVILPAANRGEEQLIILLSGDGGVVDVLCALREGERNTFYVKPVLGLLPVGTGNALANSTGLTRDDTFDLRALVHGGPRSLPHFVVRFQEGGARKDGEVVAKMYGAVVFSWGLHATIVAESDSPENRKRGVERFQIATKDELFPLGGGPPHAYKAKEVSILRQPDGEWQVMERQTHGYVLVTLVSQLEKGFTISPASRPMDGMLWLVHFDALDGNETMRLMMRAYDNGNHIEDERVGYEQIHGLRIEFGNDEDARWRRVCVDGKIVQIEEHGWVEVVMDKEDVIDLLVE
ncbi:hypothetical protein K470DRAFT_254702 [Piedraia hortae CBS 480.64]|uniref:DAGKc domain-containing protein n=1 Tax=Piedraia hortae CBS 480.64 TaxID=1314780 RepID=A0A6A7C8C5_9PEZI|nr:hypothetical protein K470DRAFT_254702 [Piedraia hortae CBS 480.64]